MTTIGHTLSLGPSGGRPMRARSKSLVVIVTRAETLLWWASVLVVTPAFLLRRPDLLAIGSSLVAIAFVCGDLRNVNRGGISAITVYSISAFVIGLANAIGLRSAGGPQERLYHLYAVPEHFFLAMELAFAGTLLPVLAYRIVKSSRLMRPLYDWLPVVRGSVPPAALLKWGTWLAVAILLMRLIAPLPALGTLTAIVLMGPQLIAFVLARTATELHLRGALVAALLIALADAVYAALYLFLRADIAAPLAAVFLGAVMGQPSISVLKRRALLPIYAAVALFVVYFGAFAGARSHRGGVERVLSAYELYERVERGEAAPAVAQQTVLSRLTTFNQLSQVGRVVREDGFLTGQTLEYLAFAFIPRFLWPEKPTIAKGAWWALRIGQANVHADGSISNSVNMTIPGELYLNFGWLGVLVGCVGFGAFLAILWDRARFWDGARNTLGSAFGFYLLWLWIALSLGPDLQVMVTMTAMYLVFVAGGLVLRLGSGTNRAGRQNMRTAAGQFPVGRDLYS
jgi:hypothetical protein